MVAWGAERMRAKLVATGIVSLTVLGLSLSAGVGLAQQTGVAEQIGEKLDSVGRGIVRGAQDVTDTVRKRFEVVRTDVSRMGVHPRVYSRLHWDKTLQGSRIEVHMLRDGVVLLRGTVPDAAAKAHAIALARDTVDVTGIVDELETVVPTPSHTTTTTTTTTVPSLTRPSR
jgi:hyperosmotically inducible periplasmic protein